VDGTGEGEAQAIDTLGIPLRSNVRYVFIGLLYGSLSGHVVSIVLPKY